METKIEWAHYTFNPWEGCAKVSPACALCYAWRRDKWLHRGANWGETAPRMFRAEAYWGLPRRWDRAAEQAGEPKRVFCGSLMDIFERHRDPAVAAAQAEARRRLGEVIRETPGLIWMLLTKRPEHGTDCAGEMGFPNGFPEHVWLGATVESDEYRGRIKQLVKIPASLYFLSMEPLLGLVDIRPWTEDGVECSSCGWIGVEAEAIDSQHGDSEEEDGLRCPGCSSWCAHTPLDELISLVITGGESDSRGGRARPSHPDWFRKLRDDCVAAGTAFFFKQWGEYRPLGRLDGSYHDNHADVLNAAQKDSVMIRSDGSRLEDGPEPRYSDLLGGYMMERVGKKAAGRLLDGREWNELPGVSA